MVVFGSPYPATIVRSPGTAEETQWTAVIGGDFDQKALLQADDRVMFGDEIHCDRFDQPRLVVRVKPHIGSGKIAFWEATLIPHSDWLRLYATSPAAETAVGEPDMACSADEIHQVKEVKAASEEFVGSELDSEDARTNAITTYITHWGCSEASLARAALVNPSDLSKWKKGGLLSGSEKAARIRKALAENEPPVLPPGSPQGPR